MAKKVRSDSGGIVIPGPDEFNEPPDDFLAYTTIIFGEKGIGKTSLMAQFPNCVVAQMEPRRKNLRIRQVLIETWEEVLDFTAKVKKDSTVDMVGFDTFDRLYELASAYQCNNQGIKDPNEANDFGATWRAITDNVSELLSDLAKAGKNFVFSSHAKWKEVELRNGKKREILVPTMTDSAWKIVKAICDFAFYYGYYDNQRALYLRGHQQLWSACGSSEHFLDPEGRPVKTILLGENPEEAYSTLLRSFNNEIEGVEDEDLETLTTIKRPWKKKKKD